MPGILLAEILYERNQLSDVDSLLDRYLPVADQFGFVDQLIAGYICKARRLVATGADTESKRVLRDAEAIADFRNFPRLGMKIKAESARQALLARDIETAKQIFRESFCQEESRSLYPDGRGTSLDATKSLTWCRLARMEGRVDEASAVCRRWIHFTKNRNAVRTSTQFGVLHAYVLQQSGDHRACMRALRNALVTGLQMGLVRTIVDEMEGNESLLSKFVEAQCANDDPLLEYAQNLAELVATESGHNLAVTPRSAELLSSEPLNERECEILKLVAAGLLNREVAESLSLSEGSVKWYMQQIYDKVGVRRRAQATQRARELGFID